MSIEQLFHSFCQAAKAYACGPDPMPEWNDKFQEAQLELLDLLSPLYAQNARVRVLLEPFVRVHQGAASAAGVLAIPDLYRVLAARVTSSNKSIHYASESELPVLYDIVQRRPSLDRQILYYTNTEGALQLTPAASLECTVSYLKQPAPARLVYGFQAEGGSGQVRLERDAVATVDAEWNDSALNLLLYKLLEKYGLMSREQLLIEYGKLGLTSDPLNQPS